MDNAKNENKQIMAERRGSREEVLWITLNNPSMHNALTDGMQKELIETLTEAEGDPGVRVVVLTGAGEKAFCSGGNISLLNKLNNRDGYDYFYRRGAYIQRILTTMEKPVIAMVRGYCFAGGLELALCCDMIYASLNAVFAVTEVDLGILPGWGGSVRLPRKIGASRAKEMILTSERINAGEAMRVGLVNKIFPDDQLQTETEKVVETILAKPPLAVRAAKTLITDSLDAGSMEAAMTLERGMLMWLINSEDFQEGTTAFIEKRPGKYQGY